MASLRQLVKVYKEDLMDGIQWVVFWKNGRSWHADTIFTEIDDDNPDPEYDPISTDIKAYLQAIYNQDNKAIILNGYYGSSFYADEPLAEWVNHVRYCYESQLENAYQVKRFLELREVVLTEKDKKDIAKAIEVKEKAEAVIKAKEETPKRDITQAIEDQKFLDSEVGAELIENVLAWDKALAQGNEEKVKECITYWRGMQAALKYFTGVNYHFARTKMSCGIIKENEYWLFKIR